MSFDSILNTLNHKQEYFLKESYYLEHALDHLHKLSKNVCLEDPCFSFDWGQHKRLKVSKKNSFEQIVFKQIMKDHEIDLILLIDWIQDDQRNQSNDLNQKHTLDEHLKRDLFSNFEEGLDLIESFEKDSCQSWACYKSLKMKVTSKDWLTGGSSINRVSLTCMFVRIKVAPKVSP